MQKIRVDQLLVDQKLAESRSQAQRLVMAGQVLANGQLVQKAAEKFQSNVTLSLKEGPRFVSRGGEKLAAAIELFGMRVDELTCADVGASTGGFTDCLLQQGAKKVYALDVGKGILHWKLRQDARVVVMESCNARHVEQLPEPVDLVTIDASFISLKILLPVVREWFKPEGGFVMALVKPQFEAGRKQAAKGKGVIRDPQVHRQVLMDVLSKAHLQGYNLAALESSPVLGPKGNIEFLALFQYPAGSDLNFESKIAALFPEEAKPSESVHPLPKDSQSR